MGFAPNVRSAGAADIAAITAIYGHHVLTGCATFEIEPPTEAEMLRRYEELTGGGLPYLVVEVGGAVVGYAYASYYRPRPAYRFTVEDSIYLSPEHVGQGLGALLLKSLIAACRKSGWRQMVAVIGDSRNLASIRLHEAFGFRRVGTFEEVGFKFERWVDTVLMQLALSEVPAAPEAPPKF